MTAPSPFAPASAPAASAPATSPGGNDYLKSAVWTASPAALHGMIADAAVRFSAAAAEALADGPGRDEAAGYAALDRAVACVSELIAGVKPEAARHEPGGEAAEAVAESVAGRFAFCLGRLADAGRTNSAGPARDAARVLGVHADTWRELLRGDAGSGAHEPAAEPVAFVPMAAPADAAPPAPRSWAA